MIYSERFGRVPCLVDLISIGKCSGLNFEMNVFANGRGTECFTDGQLMGDRNSICFQSKKATTLLQEIGQRWLVEKVVLMEYSSSMSRKVNNLKRQVLYDWTTSYPVLFFIFSNRFNSFLWTTSHCTLDEASDIIDLMHLIIHQLTVKECYRYYYRFCSIDLHWTE